MVSGSNVLILILFFFIWLINYIFCIKGIVTFTPLLIVSSIFLIMIRFPRLIATQGGSHDNPWLLSVPSILKLFQFYFRSKASWSYFHGDRLQWVEISTPSFPHTPMSVGIVNSASVMPLKVNSIQVGVMAGSVPPSSSVFNSAVLYPDVIVSVLCRERHSVTLG